jgi:hypothetical protein
VTFGLAKSFFSQAHNRRNGISEKFCVCLYQCASLEISERPLAFSGLLFCFVINAKASKNLQDAKGIPKIKIKNK